LCGLYPRSKWTEELIQGLGFSDLQQREIIQLAEFGAGKYTS
jgi:hypothetical protein